MGLERTSVVNIEAGKQQLSLRTLTLYAEAVGYNVRIAFDRIKPPTPPIVQQLSSGLAYFLCEDDCAPD